MGYDITLTEDPARPGKVLMHRPDCPAVATARAAGVMLCTMIGIERPLDRRFKQHTCLTRASERCAKCGRETKGEAAQVGTEIWCHPCAG